MLRRLFLLFLLSPCFLSAQLIQSGELVINEFMADNDTTLADQDGEFDDWIELHNNTNGSLSLQNLFLTDDLNVPDKWAFPDTSIAANGYLIIWADEDSMQSGLHANFRLSGNGESVWIGYADGTQIDVYTFTAQITDQTTGRFPSGTGSFGSMSPTPSATNSPFFNIDTIAVGDLVINEFMASNDTTVADQNGEFDDWIELYNNTNTSLSLDFLFLTDDPNDPTKWAFPDTFIGANDYLIIWADNDTAQPGLHASFGLSASGDNLWIGYADGTAVDQHGFGTQQTDITTGRFPNGLGSFQLMPPTFSAQNSTFSPIDSIQSGEVVLNEVAAENVSIATDQDGEFDDWIELYNNTSQNINLNGAFLSDDPNDLTKWAFPDTSIAANEYLILWADQDNAQAGLHLPFSLSASNGESLYFGYSDGTSIDQMLIPPQTADTTYGRFPNGTGPFGFMEPSFAAMNNDLISIDTIAPKSIVINEFMGENLNTITDQDGEFDDWIELYNNTNANLSLKNVFLSDDPANPFLWAFPDTFIGANSYLIIWADQDLGQVGLHADFRISSTNGESIFLGYADGTEIDLVSFGAQPADTTTGRFPNGTGSFGFMFPTFAADNSMLIATQIAEDIQTGIQIYPNPSRGHFTIDGRKSMNGTVEIFTVMGQRVFQQALGGRQRVEIQSMLPPGRYVIRIGTETRPILIH
ncbi:MAG: lamin tail domain-containing protein [Bacteroidota bacterium]